MYTCFRISKNGSSLQCRPYTLLLVGFQMSWFPIFQLASRLFWLAFDIFQVFLVVFWDFIPIFQLASRLFQLAFGMFSVNTLIRKAPLEGFEDVKIDVSWHPKKGETAWNTLQMSLLRVLFVFLYFPKAMWLRKIFILIVKKSQAHLCADQRGFADESIKHQVISVGSRENFRPLTGSPVISVGPRWNTLISVGQQKE